MYNDLLQELMWLDKYLAQEEKPLPNIVGSLIMILKNTLEKNGIMTDDLTPDYINSQFEQVLDDKTSEYFKSVFDNFYGRVPELRSIMESDNEDVFSESR